MHIFVPLLTVPQMHTRSAFSLLTAQARRIVLSIATGMLCEQPFDRRRHQFHFRLSRSIQTCLQKLFDEGVKILCRLVRVERAGRMRSGHEAELDLSNKLRYREVYIRLFQEGGYTDTRTCVGCIYRPRDAHFRALWKQNII